MSKLGAATLESLLEDTPAPEAGSALHSILSWSSGRPMWQRDALRRIVCNGTLLQTDHQELENIFRNGTKAVNLAGASVHPNALDSTHLPDKPTRTSAVNIASIGNLRYVNRLLTGQTLTFGTSPGITVVYGDNGSGKSGYARVIKRACRSRGAVPAIQSDVFVPVPSNGAKPSCEIMIQSAGSSIKLTWTDGVTSDPRLANVFVFDTAAAAHYLTTNAPCTFTPYGLDVLPKLVEVCDLLTKSVKATIAPLEQQIKSA